MGTFFANTENTTRQWFLVDAAGKPVGRVAVEVAKILRGKHKPTFTPHFDSGDHVIIVNAAKSVLTGGSKAEEPINWHSGYPGGLKGIARGRMFERSPERYMTRAIKGMLPHNKLGDAMLRKLRVYAGADHGHEAQKPEPLEI